MAIERFINNFQTTLSSGIDGSTTSIPVNAATSIAAQFRARIDDEIIIITANGNTTTWTATRGAEGTSNVSHPSGTTVTVVQTAGSFEQAIADRVRAGGYSSLPATSDALTGHIYKPNDSLNSFMRFNGSAWDHYAIDNLIWDPPILTDWTQTNTTAPATTTSQLNGGIRIVHPNDTATSGEWQLYHQTAPSTPYSFTVVLAHLGNPATGTSHSYFAIGWRESSSGKFAMVLGVGSSSGFEIRSELWTDVFTPSTTYVTATQTYWANFNSPTVISAPKFYLAVSTDGTTRKVYYSYSGLSGDYTELDSRAHTADITPNQILFGNNSDNAGEQRTVILGYKIRTGSTTVGPG